MYVEQLLFKTPHSSQKWFKMNYAWMYWVFPTQNLFNIKNVLQGVFFFIIHYLMRSVHMSYHMLYVLLMHSNKKPFQFNELVCNFLLNITPFVSITQIIAFFLSKYETTRFKSNHIKCLCFCNMSIYVHIALLLANEISKQ